MKVEKYRVIKLENYKDWDNLENVLLIEGSPIKELRKRLANECIYRGNSNNWNICLVDFTFGRHLHYIVGV